MKTTCTIHQPFLSLHASGVHCAHTQTCTHAHTHTKINTVDNLSYSGLPFMAESPVCDGAARWGRQLLDSIFVWYQIGRPNIGMKTWFVRSDTTQGQRRKHKTPNPYNFMPNPNLNFNSHLISKPGLHKSCFVMHTRLWSPLGPGPTKC